MEFQIAEAIELIAKLAETENLTKSQAFAAFVSEAGLDMEHASVLKAALFEEYTLHEMASDSLTNALHSVFVKGAVEEIQEMDQKETQEGTKYKVRVKDRASGSSYVRYATRAKIAELRANPNISSVELTDHGTTGEDDRGDRTASAKRGDYDGDGKKESSSKEHAGVVHNAIQRKMGGTPDGQDTRKEEVEITEGDRPSLGQIWADRRNKAHREAGYANDQIKWEKRDDKKKKKAVKEDAEHVEEGIDPKGAARMDAAKKKKKVDVFAYDRKLQAQGKLKDRKLPPAPKNEEFEVEEGIDFKGAAREQERRDRIQAEKDKKNPSGKDRRLMLRKFRPGASQEERAEGGRDSMREKGTSPKKDGKKMFEAYLELREAKAKTKEEARKKLDAHRSAMAKGTPEESPYGAHLKKDGKDPWSSHADDAKAHAKEDQKEGYVIEGDLVDAGSQNQSERSRKKLTGKDVDNSTSIKLMPRLGEAVVTEHDSKAAKRLAGGVANESLRDEIKQAFAEECCPKCGTPECTCEEKKEEKPKKKKAKLDEAGMPILEYSRNDADGPTKEMIDPEKDPNGERGVKNPKGKPKRPMAGDRRPNAGGPDLPFDKGTVPNGAGV